eukprot:TRINITY_DN15409_c0_g1_i2.p2 TRINITY_DN15409_c0_g1~~TRINITY_DN15409_c0_g1_i2.p2  ORF type:complete len:199 (-),score=50.11 TRINITY_DN15409_c0_g1_i2:49-645(-)
MLAEPEETFEVRKQDPVVSLCERVAHWLGKEADTISLSFKGSSLRPHDTFEEQEVVTSGACLTASVSRPKPWSDVGLAELLQALEEFQLVEDGVLQDARAQLEAGALDCTSFRANFTPRLVALGEEALTAWKRRRAKAKSDALMEAAKHARDELVKKRCSIMADLRAGDKPQYSHIQNGRTSRALIGGGPITKTACEW